MQTLGIVRSSSEVSLAGFRVADLARGERGRAVARASRRVGRTAATAGSCRPRGEGGRGGRGEREGGRRTGARREGRQAAGRGRLVGDREVGTSRSSLVAGSIWHAHHGDSRRVLIGHREHSSRQAQRSACGRDRQSYRECPVGDDAEAVVVGVVAGDSPLDAYAQVGHRRLSDRFSDSSTPEATVGQSLVPAFLAEQQRDR